MKCDETRPICQRCVKFGIKCDGYPPNEPSQRQASPPRRPSNSWSAPLDAAIALLDLPNTYSFDNEDEFQYFSLFRDKTIFQIIPYFDQTPFRTLILQACDISSIRHAVIAIGALDKTCMTVNDQRALCFDRHTVNATSHHQNAIKEYIKAIRIMKEEVASGQPSLRTTLLTCLVIVCFEYFHGNYRLADAQIHNGIALIDNWRRSFPYAHQHPLGFSSPAPDIVEDQLIQVFGQLEVQSLCFAGDPRTPAMHWKLRNEGTAIIRNMPDCFDNIYDAKIYQALILRRLQHWQFCIGANYSPPISREVDAEKEVWGATSCVDHSQLRHLSPESGSSVSDRAAQHRFHLEEFYHWKYCFDNFLEREPAQKNTLATALLVLCFMTTNLHLSTALAGDATIYDQYTKEFVEIVEHCEKTLVLLHKKADQKVVFTFDSGTILPLYFTALSCRVPKIRRRAISVLLAWPRREGVSDSLFAGKSAEWIVGIEEENMEDGYVPGWARVKYVGTSFSLLDRRAELVCNQPILTPDGKSTRERRQTITW